MIRDTIITKVMLTIFAFLARAVSYLFWNCAWHGRRMQIYSLH